MLLLRRGLSAEIRVLMGFSLGLQFRKRIQVFLEPKNVSQGHCTLARVFLVAHRVLELKFSHFDKIGCSFGGLHILGAL